MVCNPICFISLHISQPQREVSVAALRQHLPGPHPDENLYATSIMPLGATKRNMGSVVNQWFDSGE